MSATVALLLAATTGMQHPLMPHPLIPFVAPASALGPGLPPDVLAKGSSTPRGLMSRERVCSCPKGYPNLIRVPRRSSTRITAGLEDRLTDLYVFATLATSLCARLQYLRPCDALSRAQAHGTIATSVGWETFVVPIVNQDGSKVLVEETNHTPTAGFVTTSGGIASSVGGADRGASRVVLTYDSMGISPLSVLGLLAQARAYQLASVPFELTLGLDWITAGDSLTPTALATDSICARNHSASETAAVTAARESALRSIGWAREEAAKEAEVLPALAALTTAFGLWENATASAKATRATAAAARRATAIASPANPVISSVPFTVKDGRKLDGKDNGAREAYDWMGSGLVRFDAPAAIRAAAEAASRQMGLQPKAYNTLHVRRGDMKGYCNTSACRAREKRTLPWRTLPLGTRPPVPVPVPVPVPFTSPTAVRSQALHPAATIPWAITHSLRPLHMHMHMYMCMYMYMWLLTPLTPVPFAIFSLVPLLPLPRLSCAPLPSGARSRRDGAPICGVLPR